MFGYFSKKPLFIRIVAWFMVGSFAFANSHLSYATADKLRPGINANSPVVQDLKSELLEAFFKNAGHEVSAIDYNNFIRNGKEVYKKTGGKTFENHLNLLQTAVKERAPSLYGPHPSQEGLRPLYEKIAWARQNTPARLEIANIYIYAFLDQKNGKDSKEAISFGMVLKDGRHILLPAPVMGGISSGELEPETHPDISKAIKFFNEKVKNKFIGLNISRPEDIDQKIAQIDAELRNKAEDKDKEKPKFSYIGAELGVGISMMSSIALAEALGVPVEVVENYRYNEYCLSNGLEKAVRGISIPVNFSVVWEGGKHGVAKTLSELIKEGVIKDGSRFPARFNDPKLIANKDKAILLAMVPPQELQIMAFTPDWKEAYRIGVALTKEYRKLLEKNGIKTKYGDEYGFTTDQIRTKEGKMITLELVLEILDQAVDSLPKEDAKYVRYALDLASSEMYIPEIDMYYIGPEAAGNNDGLVTNKEFTTYKLGLFNKHKRFISCEDWADEGKPEHWEDAKQIIPSMIQMGDDFDVSRADLIKKYTNMGLQNAHLQKPNQSTTVGEGIKAVGMSHFLKNVVVTSHRGMRSPEERYTAWAAIGYGTLALKCTLFGPSRGALIAALNQADEVYNSGAPNVSVAYQGALVLDPNGPYKDIGWAKRIRKELGITDDTAVKVTGAKQPLGVKEGDKEKLVYSFGDGKTEAEHFFTDGTTQKERKELFGGKGEGLHSMTRSGIPVPPGFTLTTETCKYYYKDNRKQWPPQLEDLVEKELVKLEILMKRKFGDTQGFPLLVSARSGAKDSMPGMMDTVLNIGLTDETVEALARNSQNPRFAWDSYRRLIQMFGTTVFNIGKEEFEEVLEKMKKKYSVSEDSKLTEGALKELVKEYKEVIKKKGKEMPQDVREQLRMAISAVFESWETPRAIKYREIYDIPHSLGTAVNIQAMVFGNGNDNSGTGVAFTRNPSTGEKKVFGEFLINAQGEEVVAGIRTPLRLDELEEKMPEVYEQLMKIIVILEREDKNMLDIEFTVQDGVLYILQRRVGKRTGIAATKIMVDLVNEGLLTKEEALMLITPEQFSENVLAILDPKEKILPHEILATGLPAGPGAATGQIVFSSKTAVEWSKEKKPVILFRVQTDPGDIDGMHASKGTLTTVGGMTSHAAVVGRGMGKTIIVGAGRVEIDAMKKVAHIKNDKGEITSTLKEGDWVTLNVDPGRDEGQLIQGKKNIVIPTVCIPEAKEMLSWMKEISRLRVLANAETAEDVLRAREYGAEGIGLFRTEHMFYGINAEGPLFILRKMIMSKTKDEREQVLDELYPYIKSDVKMTLEEMEGLPVTIRLLDPPLHEFIPQDKSQQNAMALIMGITIDEFMKRADKLKETNPMLGNRAVRLGIMFPEITRVYAKAFAQAAVEMIKGGKKVDLKIMVPLVSIEQELIDQDKIIVDTFKEVMREEKVTFTYKIGTMIETPRAALVAGSLAKHSDFFSYGTNDLTQMTFGFSRDDTGEIIDFYKKAGIYPEDPFAIIDSKGVGTLISMAVKNGREVNPNLEIGLCGEQGGNPESVKFFHEAGLDYVSVSPFRVLPAWLAAAQAAIAEKQSAITPLASLTMPKAEPSALIVSQEFFKDSLASRDALEAVSDRFPQMTIAFYGKDSRMLGVLVNGKNVLAGDTLEDVIAHLSEKGIKSGNIIMLNSSTEKEINRQGISSMSFPVNTAATVAVNLAVEKLLKVDGGVAEQFLNGMQKIGVLGGDDENTSNILAKIEAVTALLPNDIALPQEMIKKIEEEEKQVGNFLTQIGV